MARCSKTVASLSTLVLASVITVLIASPAAGLDRFSHLDDDPLYTGPTNAVSCRLIASLDGTAGNYRWFNLCAKYIWCYSGWAEGDAVGVLFGGSTQPAIAPGNSVKRVIYEFRGVIPEYGTVNCYLDRDNNGDGAPDGILGAHLYLAPAERWNCIDFNACIPDGVHHVIARQVHPGGSSPLFCTDGGNGPPFPDCNPLGSGPHSFYYPANGGPPIVWPGVLHPYDNFRTAIAIDYSDPCITSTKLATWGAVKGLFR